MKPLWLLDIDGVINAVQRNFATKVWPAGAWLREHCWAGDRRFRITVAMPVRDYICKVHELDLVEIRWHTTWQESAQNIASAFKLPTFRVQDAPEFARANLTGAWQSWWKLPAVWRELATGNSRPILWTDDDLDYLRPEQRATLTAAGCGLIEPDDAFGISPSDLAHIDQFLSGGQLYTQNDANEVRAALRG